MGIMTMRRRRSGAAIGSLLIAGLLTAGALPVLAQAQEEPDYPHAYPREGVTKRFENDRVIVWEVLWLDGVPQPYHRHRYDMTGVFLRWGPLRVTRPDGTFTVSETPFEIPSTFLLPQGVTHKEESIGRPERHSIMIDLKDEPPPAPAARTDLPPAVPMDGAAMMLDVERVKVWDVPLTQGQDMPLHVHNTDTVVVFLEGGSLPPELLEQHIGQRGPIQAQLVGAQPRTAGPVGKLVRRACGGTAGGTGVLSGPVCLPGRFWRRAHDSGLAPAGRCSALPTTRRSRRSPRTAPRKTGPTPTRTSTTGRPAGRTGSSWSTAHPA